MVFRFFHLSGKSRQIRKNHGNTEKPRQTLSGDFKMKIESAEPPGGEAGGEGGRREEGGGKREEGEG